MLLSKKVLLTLPSTIVLLLALTTGFQSDNLLLRIFSQGYRRRSAEQTVIAVGEAVSMKKPYFPCGVVRYGSTVQ
jgi:hypothetical protein